MSDIQAAEQEVQSILTNIHESKSSEETKQTDNSTQTETEPALSPEVRAPEIDEAREIVEIDDPKVQKRFDYVYKQMKQSDATNGLLRNNLKELNDALGTLYDRNQQLEQWALSQQDRQNKNDDETAMKSLKMQWKQALDMGDDDKVADLNEKIAEIKAEQKIKQWQQSVAAQQKPQPKQQADGWEPTQEDAQYVAQLSSETDQRGNFKRPWLKEGHPDFDVAVAEANAIATKSRMNGSNISIKSIMTELDRRMMGQLPQPSHASVLSSSMPNMPSGPSNMLSDDERYVARKLGLDEKEYKSMRMKLDKTKTFRASDFTKKKGS